MASSSSPNRSAPPTPSAPGAPSFPRSLVAHLPCLKELEEAFKYGRTLSYQHTRPVIVSIVWASSSTLHLFSLTCTCTFRRCRVCYETFTDPVMAAKCAHNFCSICVRKYVVSYKPQCPQCLEPLHEGELRPNRLLKNVMDIFFNDIMPR